MDDACTSLTDERRENETSLATSIHDLGWYMASTLLLMMMKPQRQPSG